MQHHSRGVVASSCTRITILFVFLLFVLSSINVVVAAAQTSATAASSTTLTTGITGTTTSGPKIWLDAPRTLSTNYPSANAAAAALRSGQAQPLALARGDFDINGVEDLAVGYGVGGGGVLVIHRGNQDAFAPRTKTSFEAIGQGAFPSPFLSNTNVIAVPIRPDFVVVGSYNGNGFPDLIVAARGDSAIYLLSGDGKGKFSAAKGINVGGPITALAAGNFGISGPFSKLLVGISDQTGSYLMIYTGTLNGLGGVSVVPLAAPASNIMLGELGDVGLDALFISGGKVAILHSSSMQLETLTLPVSASAIAIGSFIYDRNPQLQIAVLGTDGSVQIAAHNEFDPRAYTVEELKAVARSAPRGRGTLGQLSMSKTIPQTGWSIVEAFPGIASFSGGYPPILLRTRISDHAADDLMLLNSGHMAVIAHPNVTPGASGFTSGVISIRPYDGTAIAAVPMRTNVDGRPGVVTLHVGQVAPAAMMPLPDPTFFPNRFDDPVPTSPIANACNNVSNNDTSSSCSLREAVLKANAIAGTDTIMLAAGTYTLSIPRHNPPDYTGYYGALYVNDSLNIVGAGQNSTIIQAGTSATNGVDMVMAVNQDLDPLTDATASISNLTLRYGFNRGNDATTWDGDGGCLEFDTGTSGNANLNLTNVTLTNCRTTNGNGGGIAIFNYLNPAGTGQTTISNSIIQNNSVFGAGTGGGLAGGIWNSTTGNIPARLVVTNSQILNNLATDVAGGAGVGGGLLIFGPANGHQRPAIHASVISGNQAAGVGGGIYTTSGIVLDQGTVISNNSSGSANQVNNVDGGGIWMNISPDTADISKVTFSGNSAPNGNGGAIHVDDAGGTVNISFSRFAGNTAAGPGKNLHNRHDVNVDPGTVVKATNNWWGTNTPGDTIDPSTSTCPAGVRQICFDPWIVLTHTATPNRLRINQSSTLTADMSKDNHGNGAVLSGNLDVIVGLPITFGAPVGGTIPQAQPETLNPSALASATFNAGSSGVLASAGATVDQATVTANITVLQPPSIQNTFSPATVAVNTPTTITFNITNGNTVAIDTSFADTLPPGLVVATTPNVVSNCGGTVTAAAGASSISFSNPALAAGSCAINVNVQSTIEALYSNSVTISSTDAGNGNTASASLTVITPPHITKSFGQASIPFGGTTGLTITVSNPNQNQTLSGVSFADVLPNSAPGTLVVATPSGLNSTCTGTASGGAGSGTVSLSGASLAPGAQCTVSVNVRGTATGATNNSVTVTDTIAGTGNTGTANTTVVKADTTTTVSSTVNPSVFGQSLTFTATVSAVAPGAGTATGTVTFLDGGSPIGTGTLTGGVATFTTSSLAVGSHTITTSYGGDGNFNGSTGSLTGNPQVVNKADTTTTVTSSMNPSVFGQSVTLTATVSPVAPGAGTATGTVTFLDGGSPIGTGTLTGGIATFTTSALAAGNHTITTSFGGDASFNGSTGSLTGNPQVVNKADTTTTVTSSMNPSVFGQSVTLTATVSAVAPAVGTATGTVTFLDGGSPIGTGTLTGGIATFTTSALAVGNHTITTSYSGNGDFNGSTGSLTGNPQVVNKADTTTTVTSSQNSSVFSQSVTFTAAVSAVAPAVGTPTGTVTFLDGGSPIGTGTLTGGVATFTTSALAVGNHAITISFGGDASFNGSTGSLTGNPQVVNKADSATVVTSSVNPSVSGSSVTFTATVSAVAPGAGTPTGTVTFLDGGSPIGTGVLSGGIATLATSALAVGNRTITTSFGGDASFNGSTGSLTGNPQVVSKADTTTTVTSSPNPSLFSQSVTFTATVSVVAPGAGMATGTVTFLDGGSPIGTGTLSGGVASFTTSTLVGGNHNITTSYGGDSNFNGSTGSLTGNPQVVNKADTTTTVTSSRNPAASGQSVTFTATVSAVAPAVGTPTGTVTFLDGGSPIGTGTLAGGVATFATSALAVGNHTITISFGGDASFNGSTGSLTGNPQLIIKADAISAVTLSVNPSVFGQSVTFTATVSAVAPGAGTPTGTVTFLDGGTPLGTGTLSGGVATLTTSASAVGNHAITTSYGGDGNFNGSTASLTGTQAVNKADTIANVTSSANPSALGQSVTFTATVSAVAPGAGKPTGTVTFLDGGSPIGTGTLSGGLATFTASALTLGNHTITTSYDGDANFNASTGSLNTNPQVVEKADTTTTVTSSHNASTFGQSVTITATVAPVTGTAAPTGMVTFLDGGSPVGTGALSAGAATFTTSALATGNHTITTTYGGDASYNGSTGSLNTNPQVVDKASTTTAVTSSQNPSLLKNNVTLKAKVTSTTSGTPTGSVTFMDGSTSLGNATLDNTGTGALTVNSLSAGAHSITTIYGGDTNFTGTTSTSVTQTVQDFQFVINGVSANEPAAPVLSATVMPGAVATYQFQLSPTNGTTFPNAVTLTLVGLPAGATYTIAPATLAAGSGTQQVTLQVQTAKTVVGLHKPAAGSLGFAFGAFGLVLPFGMLRLSEANRSRTKRIALFLLLLLLVVGILGMVGCGGGSGFFNQSPQTYTLQLNATSGALQHSTAFSLTIQ